jgi:hypothetical protein
LIKFQNLVNSKITIFFYFIMFKKVKQAKTSYKLSYKLSYICLTKKLQNFIYYFYFCLTFCLTFVLQKKCKTLYIIFIFVLHFVLHLSYILSYKILEISFSVIKSKAPDCTSASSDLLLKLFAFAILVIKFDKLVYSPSSFLS